MPDTTADANLLDHPLHTEADLGKPIPDSSHAVSAALPMWADVVGYEEREARVIDAMAGGYPRFVCHRYCRRLFAELVASRSDGHACRAFASPAAAERFCAFLVERGDATAGLMPLPGGAVAGVHYDPAFEDLARAYWQHTGEGISSRAAEAQLNPAASPPGADAAAEAKLALRRRIADLAGVGVEHVWLTPTGMAAMFTIHRALRRMFPERPAAQFGFPYVDTLKVLQMFGPGAYFHPCGVERDMGELDTQLTAQPGCGLFTELPSNPLLRSPELSRLAELSRRHDAPFIVDDTLATWLNVDLAGVADVTWSSLTKYFSGVGDVAGGCLIVRPESRYADRLTEAVAAEHDDALFGPDAVVLERNSRDFSERMPRFNDNAMALAEHLADHSAVAAVHYPGLRGTNGYASVMRRGGGFGGLLSFELREPTGAPRVYDALAVNKGPNLGTNYTLACPFTILAHYGELDWAESCGVSRWLIRVSVGLEPIDDLKARFDAACGLA